MKWICFAIVVSALAYFVSKMKEPEEKKEEKENAVFFFPEFEEKYKNLKALLENKKTKIQARLDSVTKNLDKVLAINAQTPDQELKKREEQGKLWNLSTSIKKEKYEVGQEQYNLKKIIQREEFIWIISKGKKLLEKHVSSEKSSTCIFDLYKQVEVLVVLRNRVFRGVVGYKPQNVKKGKMSAPSPYNGYPFFKIDGDNGVYSQEIGWVFSRYEVKTYSDCSKKELQALKGVALA